MHWIPREAYLEAGLYPTTSCAMYRLASLKSKIQIFLQDYAGFSETDREQRTTSQFKFCALIGRMAGAKL